MSIGNPEHGRTIEEFAERLRDVVYISDMFPPPDDGEVRIIAPTPNPSLPELKSFDTDKTASSGEAREVVGQFGAFALATMKNTGREIALA